MMILLRSMKAAINMYMATQMPIHAFNVKNGTSIDTAILYRISVKARTGPVPPFYNRKGEGEHTKSDKETVAGKITPVVK